MSPSAHGGRTLKWALLAALVAAVAVAPAPSAVQASTRQVAQTFPGGPYFVLVCGFSHRNNDDPLLHPGHPGRSHNHTFVGNRSVDASTTSASLRGGSTTCELDADSSTYWVPTLYVGSEPVAPLVALVYYTKRTAESVSPFPQDLKMVAGNQHARRAQSKAVVSWSCGGPGSKPLFAVVRSCGEAQALQLQVHFPSCWNGRASDSVDHKRHMAYASGGKCPSSHPVAVPTLTVLLLYPVVPRHARVASGKFGGHADFMNGWDQDELVRLVGQLNY